MQLKDMFVGQGIAAADMCVFFHVSDKPKLHKALRHLADEQPELFNAFQNQHGSQVEATLKKRKFIASFVPGGANEYIYAGLFEVVDSQFHTMLELDADPYRTVLRQKYGDTCFVELGQRTGLAGRLVFKLIPRTELAHLVGRMVVRKPIGVRGYRFLAETLDCQIVEITRQRQLSPPSPDWRDFIVTAEEMLNLPRDWAARLEGWRGVYLITDEADGMRYVGSAYNTENLLGRWRAHVAGENGVTVELGKRSPAQFRFSILQLLLHDAEASDVLMVETNWKRRLHTRHPFGLNLN
ncbi:MAG: GIY-YIG nuclease family protein [Pseudomonadota bacterium]